MAFVAAVAVVSQGRAAAEGRKDLVEVQLSYAHRDAAQATPAVAGELVAAAAAAAVAVAVVVAVVVAVAAAAAAVAELVVED